MDTQNTTPKQESQPIISPQQPPQSTSTKKFPWLWLIGGCLMISILAIIVLAILAWWGAHKISQELNEYSPAITDVQETIDAAKKEQEEWREMSNHMQQNLSDLEEQMQNIPE